MRKTAQSEPNNEPSRQIPVSIFYSLFFFVVLLTSSYLIAQSLDESSSSIKQESSGVPQADILSRQASARKFFFTSVQEAYERIESSQKPIQVDLYILVHYLMYQDKLFFSQGPEARIWKDKISAYFIRTFGLNIWEEEGCLAAKVLIGLARASADKGARRKLEQYYSDLVLERWKGEGVGECFSAQIMRTYGVGTPECSGVSAELNAKVALYQEIVRKESSNPIHKIKMPTLNTEMPDEPLDDWWSAVTEMWIMAISRMSGQTKLNKKRIEASAKAIHKAINSYLLSKERRTGTYVAMILYSYLMSDNPDKAKADAVLKRLLLLQAKDGGFSGLSGNLREATREHNVRATPTYFSLLAMQQYLDTF